MSPIDRIAQLNAELGTLTRKNVLLRSQLHDAQEQAKRDSETIARLAADKQGLKSALVGLYENACAAAESECGFAGLVIRCTRKEWESHVKATEAARQALSRHA